ncbi:MAG: enhanced intracellular survival protein Eis [Promethearchaeota archaeon]
MINKKNREPIIVEEAKKEDFDKIIEVIKIAYEADAISPNESNNYPTYSRSIVVRVNNKIVSSLNIYNSDNIIRGTKLSCGGIGAVVTLPEHRKKGYCRKAMYEAFKNMYEKGEVVSTLEPFKEEFYEQFGYAIAEEFIRHSFDVANLRSLETSPVTYQIRKITDVKEAEAVLSLVKQRISFGSCIFPPIENIRNGIKNGNFFIFEKNSQPVGVISLGIVVYDPKYNPEPFEINQKGLHSGYSTAFTEEEVIPAMLAHIKQFCLETNGTRIVLLGQKEFPVRDFMKNRKEIHARITPGFMIRVINFKMFCKSIKIPKEACHPIVIKIEDEQCPWNNGTFKLIPKEGNLLVEESKDNIDVIVSSQALSKIIAGLLPISSIRLLGEIECSKETVDKLQAIFPQESYFVFDRI